MVAPMKWKHRERELKKLRRRHGTRVVTKMPDLSVRRTAPSLSDGFAPIVDRRVQHAPHPTLIVDTLHKQGPMVLSRDELPWAGGRKS